MAGANCIAYGDNQHPFTIKLRPIRVNYGQSVEDMMGGVVFFDSYINSTHFPDCKNGHTGKIEIVDLFLVKPIDCGEELETLKVHQWFADNGFVPRNLPVLSALKRYAREFDKNDIRVNNIVSLGKESVFMDNNDSCVVVLTTVPNCVGFYMRSIKKTWNSHYWFIVSPAS